MVDQNKGRESSIDNNISTFVDHEDHIEFTDGDNEAGSSNNLSCEGDKSGTGEFISAHTHDLSTIAGRHNRQEQIDMLQLSSKFWSGALCMDCEVEFDVIKDYDVMTFFLSFAIKLFL